MFTPCAIIPVYNHEHTIGLVLGSVRSSGLPCILVDDGSTVSCANVLDQLAAEAPGDVWLVRHAVNQGKGGAVLSGLKRAAELGFTHALQIDADGQHDTSDIPVFLALAQCRPNAVIVGSPIYDESVPRLRLYARYLTHVWVWINTLSFAIRDSMCGYRLYPLVPVLTLAAQQKLGLRMNFDPEVLVRLYWADLPVVNQPTHVRYPCDGRSHFQPVRDNILISQMHARLFFGMLLRLPLLLKRKWQRR